jgi:hypothetical protein
MQSQIKAIVYTSGTGFTAHYASLLAEATHLPCYALQDLRSLPEGTPVFYLGWLMAGQIKGLKNAQKRFQVVGVCGVGMGKPSDNPPEALQKANHLGETPTFSLQGGYAPNKLKGFYKLMMKMATKAMAKKVDPQDGQLMVNALQNGVDFVSDKNLTEILDWMQKR